MAKPMTTASPRKSDRATVADVAEAAGVSVATVDRVINGRLRVRAKTAARVQEAALAIGFHAATLISKRAEPARATMIFGFLLQRHSVQFYKALGAAMTLATNRQKLFLAYLWLNISRTSALRMSLND